MDLERLVTALGPQEVRGGAPVDVTDLAYDARAVAPGALFFCVPGERADGHEFAAEAVERGAVALVVERPLELPVPQLVVPSARAAMAVAADEFFERPTEELLLAGVTGTNGKTTTSYLLHSIFEAAGMRPGLIGTIESRVGGEVKPAVRTTPEAIDLQRTFRAMLDAGDRSAVMEATSHGSELGRLEGVRFKALAFTNLTQDHLDFHGTMERYYEAKRRLFTEHEPAPAAAINVDDEWGRKLAAELRRLDRAPVLTYGLTDDADLSGHNFATRLRGRFNALNVLAAWAVAQLVGVPDEAVTEGLEKVDSVPGRFETVEEGQPFTVVVDYSHTPDSLENVLRAARELTQSRVICVFGAGGDRDRGKRPIMGRIASELADVAIVTSDNPRSEEPQAIIDEILGGVVGEVEVEPDRRAAIERAVGTAGPRDVVVIAGKGHEQGQEFAGGKKIPFDDREVAREALRKAWGARVIPLTVDELRSLGRLESTADEVTGVRIDSRRIEPGDLFVAVRGGIHFLGQARERGAAATLVPDDDFAALAAIGRAVRDRSNAEVVGITGSTGKTSTKDILAALARPHRRTVAAEASYNAELGVPLTLARLESDTELLIAELAMRGFGQIAALCAIAGPTLGVITTIGPVHLEFVESVEGVARAKAELLEALPAGAKAVLPAAAKELEPHLRSDLDIVRVGEDARLVDFSDGRIELDLGGDRVELTVPFVAHHQAENTLTAATAYWALGLPLDRIQEGAANIELSKLRGEELPLEGGSVLINDCWNANPASMSAALADLAARNGGRRIAVLGGMAELGPEGPRYHREIGALTKDLDVVVGVGQLARDYAPTHWVPDAEAAAKVLLELLEPGDVVLVKGSRSVGLEAVAQNLT